MSRVPLRAVSAATLVAVAFAACTDAPVQVPAADVLSPQPAPQVVRGRSNGVEAVVPGELIVKLREGSDANITAVGRAHGMALKELGGQRAFAVYSVAAGRERAAAARLAADARVEYAEPNYLRQPTAIRPELWAFRNDGSRFMSFCCGDSRTGQRVTSLPSVADADQDNIEDYAAGGSPVVIGSLDTGADFNHGEFKTNGVSRLIAGRNWFRNARALPQDDDGHGTHTSGTMAGNTVGVAGVAGAAANVKIHVQKVCGARGCPSSYIASAIRAAADYPGMVAMNLSLGGPSISQAERDAITYAVNTKNVLVIASAGNDDGAPVSYPAAVDLALSVAATDWADGQAYYTNFGAGLDISAPGGEMYSNTTEEGGIYSAYWASGKTNSYAYLQGTSMAAPQVTGTAAIVASKTGLRGANLRTRLLGTADDKGEAGYDTKFGAGRLNSYHAVTGTVLGAGL